MGHDGRCLAEEAVAVIGVAVAGALGLQLCHPGYLVAVLGEVRLHGQLVVGGKVAAGAERLGRTGGNEAWGDDGADQWLRLFN